MRIAWSRGFLVQVCLTLCLSSILIHASIFRCSAQTGSATISVSPSPVTIDVGQSFRINISISNVLDLYGWEFKLGWNASLLDWISIDEGAFLNSGGDAFFAYSLNTTEEHLIVDCTLIGSVPGVDGNGTLAAVAFYAKEIGECQLHLYDVILLDSSEQQINCNAVDGYGYFTSPHDVAIAQIDVSPTAVLAGNPVQVNVTAQDQGDYDEIFNVTTYANSEVIGVKPISLNSNSSATVSFNWDTTGHIKGDYTISASASTVPNETKTANNNRTYNGIVTMLFGGHDVTIMSVEPSKTVLDAGYSADITVIAKNYGVFTETFNVTVYANTTAIQTKNLTQSTGASTALGFLWNSSSFSKGNYTISAYAGPIAGQTNTTDNNFTSGWVKVTIVGDVNGDGKVNLEDVFAVALAYGSFPGYPTWNPCYDINNDGKINLIDYFLTVLNYGKTDP